MGNLVENKFTWVIQNFNSLHSKLISSDQFLVGSCKWRLCVLPKRSNPVGYMSLMLRVGEYESLPCGWRGHAKVSFTIVNQLSETLSLQKEDPEEETSQSLKERKQDNDGLLSSDLLNLTQQPKEVNGFLVLPSQAKTVKLIFEKHPNVALNFQAKSHRLRTSCMNVLLDVIETLCQSLQDLSIHDLGQADNALTYLKNSGFKVDWLEHKLDEVMEKKIEEEVSETRMQELKVELKGFKEKCSDLKNKCSDTEALLKKEQAKVLAARVRPPTLNDVV